MLLGDLLQEARRNPDPELLMSDDMDLVMLARAGQSAEMSGNSLSQLLREAVESFVNEAGEEDWAGLIGRLQNGQASPGACLNLMLRRYLRKTASHGCGC